MDFKFSEIFPNHPTDWKNVKVKKIASINEDYIQKLSPKTLIQYIDISSVFNGRNFRKKCLNIENAPSRAKRRVKRNDILISMVRPNLKHFCFLKTCEKNTIASTGFVVISPKSINPRFLYYQLSSEAYTKYLAQVAETHSGAYPSFTPDVIEETEIFLPPEPDQEIVDLLLGSIEDKIKLNIKINETLEFTTRAIFKARFIDFEDSTEFEFKNNDLGRRPKGWTTGVIGDIATLQGGYSFKSKDFLDKGRIGVIKIKNISNNVVNVQEMKYIPEKIVKKRDKRFLIDPGSILIAMTGAHVGKLGIVPRTEKELWLNQRVGMFKEKIENGKYWIYLLLTSEEYQYILQDRASGSAQPNISGSDIESIDIILPPNEVIIEFGSLVEPMLNKLINNLYENELLLKLRDKLIPRLISGELRISNPHKFLEGMSNENN